MKMSTVPRGVVIRKNFSDAEQTSSSLTMDKRPAPPTKPKTSRPRCPVTIRQAVDKDLPSMADVFINNLDLSHQLERAYEWLDEAHSEIDLSQLLDRVTDTRNEKFFLSMLCYDKYDVKSLYEEKLIGAGMTPEAARSLLQRIAADREYSF